MSETIEHFKKKLAEIKEISTLPHVMVRIMEIVTDEHSSAADLADEIAKDTPLTAKILKIVNSAYYGFYREIANVSDAVVVLGFNEIRRLSLAISVLDMLGGTGEQRRLEFWNHSFLCAAMSDILAKQRRLRDRGAFTAGLLHDIGKSILDQYFSHMSTAVQECMRERSLHAHEAERLLYGFDHGDIGYWLSDRWNLPVSLSEAIRYHHRPGEATETPELAQVVHVADKLSYDFAKLKARNLPLIDAPGSVDDELTPEEKAKLLSMLEDRIKESAMMNIFT